MMMMMMMMMMSPHPDATGLDDVTLAAGKIERMSRVDVTAHVGRSMLIQISSMVTMTSMVVCFRTSSGGFGG
jgi:hypothetical protein